MAISVRQIYEEFCDTVLEPGGLTGLTITESEFLRLLNDALRNIMQASSCFIKINNIPLEQDVRIYNHAYFINQPVAALAEENTIFESAGNFWDNSDYRWLQLGSGTPQEWRLDQLQEDQIEVRPAPSWDGYTATFSAGYYGTLSATSSANSYNLDIDPASSGMYGTISETDLGDVYVEVTAPLYGTIASIQESGLNLTEITTYTFENEIASIDAYIPDLPDSFKPYVKFAVLSLAFSMDGEIKNDVLTKYYKQRTNELFGILRSVTGEALLEGIR